MHTKHYIIAALLFVAFASSALAQNKNGQKVGYDEATAVSVETVTSAHITPIVADVNVSNTKISHSETFSNELSRFDIEHPDQSAELHYLKNYTLNKAISNSKADMIIAPIYEINTSADMNTITVSVSGYPASYINFRTASKQDLDLIRDGHQTSKLTPTPSVIQSNTEKTDEK